MKSIIASGVVLLAALGSVIVVEGTKEASLVDNLEIQEIIDRVCQDNDAYEYQIGRISTIRRLGRQFERIDANHKLASCKSKFGESIKNINSVVSKEAGICSSEKITTLEQFHRDYVSTVSKFKEIRRQAGKTAPKMIKTFFMHYATHVSSVCANLTVQMISQSLDGFDDEEGLQEMLRELGKLDTNLSPVERYSDIFLLWNLIASLPSSLTGKLNKYIQLDEEIKMTVEVRNVTTMHTLQEACKTSARPFYSVAMLPFVRLVDLGYYPHSDALIEQLKTDKFTRATYWYTIICENFLPIRFVENPTLVDGKTLMVESSIAHQKYGGSEKSSAPRFEITVDYSDLVDTIIVSSNEGLRSSAKRIKSQVKTRGKTLKQFLKRIVQSIKKKPASTLDILLMSDTNESVLEYVSQVEEQEIPNLSEDETRVEGTRDRRSVKKILRAPFIALAYVGLAILYFLLIWLPNNIFFPALAGTIIAMRYIIVEPLKKIFG